MTDTGRMTPFADGALTLEFDGAVATLTLNRPGRCNAIGAAMWEALPATIARVAAHADNRLLVVRGAGGHFAAGADIGEFDTVFADRAATLHYGATMAAATRALATLDRPTIARIDGYCIGAGVALALACDLRIAASDATFAVTPSRLGLLFSLADTRRLMLAVGSAAAKDLLFTGRRLEAASALAMGIVSELAAPAALDALVAARAEAITSASQWSVRYAKRVVAEIECGIVDDTEETRGWFADATESDDFRDRLLAFRARRPGPPSQR